MPLHLQNSREMEDYEAEISVIDVYDIATEIGKEFEKIIDAHGVEAVTGLMPNVINALEHLEVLATKNECENTLIEELKAKIVKLESDKVEKAEDRQRFERELEQIEDHWREETQDLVAMVTKLQEENRKLISSLAAKEDSSSDGPSQVMSPEVDICVLQRLRGMVDKLREQLRAKDKEIAAKNAEVENLRGQHERLTNLGKELRRKHRLSQIQIRNVIDERADLFAQAQEQMRELEYLRQHLGLAQKENEDLSRLSAETPNIVNKAVYDLDDPNRPRFTTSELKGILHERNELKARVSDLEDELEMYRPKQAEIPRSASGSGSEEELPVQGPLPYEPDDAPWKRSDSGIRKLLSRFWS
ncbi:rab interacting lysosomal protein like isoform X2 [Lycorma delicatula]|uniref:rab interacting lysosomal protein like isoform X2 n=1 Tax=Lycorma delicatula TaxID=130591 RepID=UPI003F511768